MLALWFTLTAPERRVTLRQSTLNSTAGSSHMLPLLHAETNRDQVNKLGRAYNPGLRILATKKVCTKYVLCWSESAGNAPEAIKLMDPPPAYLLSSESDLQTGQIHQRYRT
jgi:hypothetical protein